uniref:Ribosomal protein L5 n=1 Tax=Panagrolaimus sp. JU765 TaxID=591449 RepID=A0AC34Q1C2_9BILA
MRNGNKRQVYLTFIEGDNFGFEIYSRDASVVTVDERITSENERILTFSRMKFPCEPFKEIPLDVDIPFNVTTASSRKRPIYSGILTRNEREFKIKNVKPKDWIKVTFASGNIEHQIRYSKKFLNTYFPRSKHVFAFQHLEKINSILDMQIGITPLDLAEINFVFESRGIIANVPTHFTRSRSTKRKIYN